jgi:trk system potassium uptake protein TrkA
MIDCCFSPIISAINVMIGLIGSDKRRTIALLKRTSAEVAEFTVTKQSPICGKPIKDCACPDDMVFALILREKDLLPAIGDTELKVGDRVVMLAKEDAVQQAEKLFVRGRPWKG